MDIYRNRAHHGLTIHPRTLTNAPVRYGHIEQLRTPERYDGARWTTRDDDIALSTGHLYRLGGYHRPAGLLEVD